MIWDNFTCKNIALSLSISASFQLIKMIVRGIVSVRKDFARGL